METTKTRYQCRHIFTAGRRCQSPSLRGQDLCYFHQTTRPDRRPPQHTHPEAFTLPMPEDRAAIQLALGQVIARIAAGTLNARRAGLLLYALQIASLNLPKATESDPETQVEEVIEDPTHKPIVIPTEAADSLIVRRAVEGPPNFAFALAVARPSSANLCIFYPANLCAPLLPFAQNPVKRVQEKIYRNPIIPIPLHHKQI